ncbi:potassium-transporting ATPase subunit KdpA [Pseudomonas sp. SbB1]|jgi:K+-transporting ATPase ATPase A chain|uniref:Potassium-transporting ATPase potassium-binding subunit n=1 Tax=Pseudomonas putida (strain GB-1) TaxID=76869 RepID=B0KNU4_PSEPG|nr:MULTISPECIES: potassium-transporting ATPase subunit KdpA [Pseudomonas]ABY99623.1 potassium-transporting ATPase, A subunit [Pseudomonas putida GB-1]MBP0707237.1 potassium-transporting ATPase subunit KdpA [Pseudomonas sp. T34]MCK2186677.1 potassium-transporting ATPase subunit KdpA [Pseudomonas sp. MB04B]MDD2083216.1 potassium-transporting ATPase subunit KdpA [Pseudomonas putida]MDD2093882.1 potassium-transporting ATPase subunit KdpA [Pseudomonas putida]
MHSYDFALLLAFFAIVLLPAPWLGRFYFKVMEGQRTWLSPLLGPVEQVCYRLAGVNASQEQNWRQYTLALLVFNLAGFLLLFAVLLLQGYLPLNPQHLPGQEWSLAFNTAVSFVTNTNWQAYSGEASVSYLSQMLGLTVQNFVSAATGLAVLVALCRGIARRSATTLGNFWVDMTRATLYGLLPLCLLLALLLVWQGVPQTFADYAHALTLQGADQTIPLGPAASQIAIKQLGTNGGGFFGVNSAHPFENPTAWSNLFEVASIILIPVALVFTFGHYVKDLRQSRAILACMLALFLIGGGTALWSEHQPNPALESAQVQQAAPMEGKESRFGTTGSVLWTVTTTAASNGSVNAMHDSLNPLTGMVAMVNMMVGEVIFGGVGAGLYGMLLFVLIAVFLAGLMIGRTPEYLGKKLQAREVQLLVATLLVMPVGVLVLGAIAASLPGPAGAVSNPGAHGFSQLLYAYTSGTANNGSAFAGFAANTVYHNLMIGLAMLIGRFGYILPILALAGSLAAKKSAPQGQNSFPTHGPLFTGLLLVTILLVGGLTFLPTLALGPIAEHLSLGF